MYAMQRQSNAAGGTNVPITDYVDLGAFVQADAADSVSPPTVSWPQNNPQLLWVQRNANQVFHYRYKFASGEGPQLGLHEHFFTASNRTYLFVLVVVVVVVWPCLLNTSLNLFFVCLLAFF